MGSLGHVYLIKIFEMYQYINNLIVEEMSLYEQRCEFLKGVPSQIQSL